MSIMLPTRKKRKSSGNIAPTKAHCPYCSKFFQYLNQHWSQISNCSRLHDARTETVSDFASLRDERLSPSLPVSGVASLRGPRDTGDSTIGLQSFVASRAAIPPTDLHPVDYPSADDSEGNSPSFLVLH